MTDNVNPEMIQLARESRGLNRSELARLMGVSQPFISMLETGDRPPSDDVMENLCNALDYPQSFFEQKNHILGIGMSLFFRKKASTRIRDLRRLEAEVNIRRLVLRHLLNEVEIDSPNRIDFIDVDEHGGNARKIAALVRASWQLPMGPIRNLTRAIERAGGIIFRFSFSTRDIDAVSLHEGDAPPLFFVNADAPADRVRFSLAHELGHVVMHRAPGDTMENEADMFASEFLMPAKDIAPDLRNLTLTRAANLKRVWGVSMAALIRRARDLDRLPQERYQGLMRQLSSTGQRRKESVEIPNEAPSVLAQLVTELTTSSDYSIDDLARLTHLSPIDFKASLLPPQTGLRLVD